MTQLRAGTVFEENGEPYLVLKYEHTKMGRGTASIKVKVRSLKSKATTEKTFISGARVQEASIVKQKLQYLYKEGENFCFIDPKTFEQCVIPQEVMSGQEKFLKEGNITDVLFWNETSIGIELAPKMEFTIKETGPGMKGNSATNIFKTATLDNGVIVRVPLFVNQGEKILIDTRNGEYVERVK